jgi:hypothetical protein
MTEARFWLAVSWAEDGAAPVPLPATRGDLELMAVENRLFCSGVRVLAEWRLAECVLGRGWPMERALTALEPGKFLLVSRPRPMGPSMEVLVESLPALEMRLGRLFCGGRYDSSPSRTPGPMDFLGGLPMLPPMALETGG